MTAIARAVELSGPTPTGFLHTSPEYMAARFAFYDDRLDEAWSANLAMLAQVERLGRLVTQLLDLSRLESGAVPLDWSEFDVKPVLEHAVREQQLQCK